MTLRSTMTLLAAGAISGLAIPSGVGAHSARVAAACAPVSNIEAIVDDSGSMKTTDPNRLRVQALDLLIETPGNEGITFGAIEFGGALFSGETAADTLFPPEPIGPNAKAMQARLAEKIKADNPTAQARMFLTDGGHDMGEYENGHRGGPPTYVIGFSSAISGADGERLQLIANDTGGKYYPQTDSSNLQAVVNQIGTTLTCQSTPAAFKDAFARAGQSKTHAVAIGSKVHSAQLTLSWGSPLDAFTISNLKIVSHGKTVAVAARKHVIKV